MTITDRLADRLGLLRPAAARPPPRPSPRALSLVSSGPGQPVRELSGGNQQKVTVARTLAHDPGLIVAITPTRGVDVASKALLLDSLADVASDDGAGVLLCSDELSDLVICDRVIVLVRGEVFTEFTEPPFDRDQLIVATEGLYQHGSRHRRGGSAMISNQAPDGTAGTVSHASAGRAPVAPPRRRCSAARVRGMNVSVLREVGAAARPRPPARRRRRRQPGVPDRLEHRRHRPADLRARRRGRRREPDPHDRRHGPVAGVDVRPGADGRRLADPADRRLRQRRSAQPVPRHPGPARGRRRGRPDQRPADREGPAQRLHRHPRHDDRAGRPAERHRQGAVAVQPADGVRLPRRGVLRPGAGLARRRRDHLRAGRPVPALPPHRPGHLRGRRQPGGRARGRHQGRADQDRRLRGRQHAGRASAA